MALGPHSILAEEPGCGDGVRKIAGDPSAKNGPQDDSRVAKKSHCGICSTRAQRRLLSSPCLRVSVSPW